MPLLDQLASGKLGVIAAPPKSWQLQGETDDSAEFVDPTKPIGAYLFFFPDLHLDLGHAEDHRRDIERHTRALFDTMFAIRPPENVKPRTGDATWSPVIEVERFDAPGGPAIHILHRMSYHPGSERIMGHTLVPTARGLFEARWYTMSQQTGVRESVLSIKNNGTFTKQSDFDDPKHDAMFPQHPLSLARAAKRWFADGKLEVTQPATPPQTEVALVGHELSLPPRFVLAGRPTSISAQAARVSFAGTDGVDAVIIERTDERFRLFAQKKLASLARERTKLGLENEQVTPSSDTDFIVEGDTGVLGAARVRTAWHWFLDGDGYAWHVRVQSSIAVPADELLALARQVAK